jgi:hypothetical protein
MRRAEVGERMLSLSVLMRQLPEAQASSAKSKKTRILAKRPSER